MVPTKLGSKNKHTCKLNYYDQKIRQILVCDIRDHWTAVSTLSGLFSSVYRDFPHRIWNKQPQNAEPKPYLWAIDSYRRQVN